MPPQLPRRPTSPRPHRRRSPRRCPRRCPRPPPRTLLRQAPPRKKKSTTRIRTTTEKVPRRPTNRLSRRLSNLPKSPPSPQRQSPLTNPPPRRARSRPPTGPPCFSSVTSQEISRNNPTTGTSFCRRACPHRCSSNPAKFSCTPTGKNRNASTGMSGAPGESSLCRTISWSPPAVTTTTVPTAAWTRTNITTAYLDAGDTPTLLTRKRVITTARPERSTFRPAGRRWGTPRYWTTRRDPMRGGRLRGGRGSRARGRKATGKCGRSIRRARSRRRRRCWGTITMVGGSARASPLTIGTRKRSISTSPKTTQTAHSVATRPAAAPSNTRKTGPSASSTKRAGRGSTSCGFPKTNSSRARRTTPQPTTASRGEDRRSPVRPVRSSG
mmetsp:Transcript_16070/g.46260  ORF Transcript_16070/g.46260 Transcript_16070/m.46260 type:complete len:383 (+) Transcript_16070:483-1631(+)